MDDEERFVCLRKKVMQAIKRAIEYDSYSKSYEGIAEPEWMVTIKRMQEDEE